MTPEAEFSSRSFEKQVKRAKRAIVVWRLIGILICVPSTLLRIAAAVCEGVANLFTTASNAIFTLECDAARRYEALTGVRLGPAIGQGSRYTDLHPLPGDGTLGEWPVTWGPQHQHQ